MARCWKSALKQTNRHLPCPIWSAGAGLNNALDGHVIDERTYFDRAEKRFSRVALCQLEIAVELLTPDMVDRKTGVVKPEGGRLKTQGTTDGEQQQVAPLTAKARAVLDEIDRRKRSGKIVTNTAKLVFTRDGSRVSKDMIHTQVQQAIKATAVKKFTFQFEEHRSHQLGSRGRAGGGRHKASGHSSVQMHQRYVDLQRSDVAKAFGAAILSQKCDRDVTQKSVETGNGQ